MPQNGGEAQAMNSGKLRPREQAQRRSGVTSSFRTAQKVGFFTRNSLVVVPASGTAPASRSPFRVTREDVVLHSVVKDDDYLCYQLITRTSSDRSPL